MKLRVVLLNIWCCLSFFPFASWAFEQQLSFWPGMNYQNYLTENHKLAYLMHSQLRFMNKDAPLKTGLVEGSVGYALNNMQRLWVGYYWAENDPYHNSFQENRVWQQFYWKLQDDNQSTITSRTRIEEIKFSNEAQQLNLMRQMFAKEFVKNYYGRINPLIYDETFFRLNHPSYASTSFFAQNRLFLGVNIYSPNSRSFWKVGYINQYLSGNSKKSNGMNHILTIMYTFGVPQISLPVDS